MKISSMPTSILAVLLVVCMATPRTSADPNDAASTSATSSSENDIKVDVQVTELGMMRALLVLDSKAIDSQKVIAQRLSDSDFRLFPSPTDAGSSVTMDEMKDLGQKNKADLVFYATVSTRLKNKFQDFSLYEGEATVQVYSPVTGEMMVTQTTRTNGERNTDDLDAERSASEKALDSATKTAVVKILNKAQKIIVHEAIITGVYNDNQLLAIMEYMGEMQGVYGVRQVSFDRENKIGVIDIIGNPRSETYWRAYLEKMPKAQIIKVRVITNPEIRKMYPSWFND